MKLKEPENKNYAALGRKCPSCLIIKDLSEFAKSNHTKSGHQSWCKSCTNKQTLERHHRLMKTDEYKEKRRARSLEVRYKYKYGITLEEKINMITTQNNECAMCHKTLIYKTSVVDHDHQTGKVRAILCIKCNTGLSYIENKKFLKSALEYIKNNED